MFDPEFYPTPTSTIIRMVTPYITDKAKNLSILEPQAGKGDIADYLQKNEGLYRRGTKIYCIEKNPELKYILQQKGHRVIAEDFLTYKGDYLFDLIIMNPPFSNGDEHMLKAWDVLEAGDIACLLNEETVTNLYTERRRHLRSLIDQHGSVEHLGPIFRNAERPTSVNVVLVRLKKQVARKRLEFEFHGVNKEQHEQLDESTFTNAVALRDVVGNMALQYESLKHAFAEYLRARDGLEFFAQGLLANTFRVNDSRAQSSTIVNIAAAACEEKGNNARYNAFCDIMKEQIWSVMLSKTNVEKYMTDNVRKNFVEFAKHQGYMDFTRENVAAMVSMVFDNRETIMEQAIVDVFNHITEHHKDNRYLVEGWKTNDRWKVNRKIILPYIVAPGFDGCFEVSYHGKGRELFRDIEKVMCYITGTRYEDFTDLVKEAPYGTKERDKPYRRISLDQAIRRTRYGSTEKTESEFFRIRCFKKGTIHMEFKDERLWNEFNLRACSGKQWLPPQEEAEYRSRRPGPIRL